MERESYSTLPTFFRPFESHDLKTAAKLITFQGKLSSDEFLREQKITQCRQTSRPKGWKIDRESIYRLKARYKNCRQVK